MIHMWNNHSMFYRTAGNTSTSGHWMHFFHHIKKFYYKHEILAKCVKISADDMIIHRGNRDFKVICDCHSCLHKAACYTDATVTLQNTS